MVMEILAASLISILKWMFRTNGRNSSVDGGKLLRTREKAAVRFVVWIETVITGKSVAVTSCGSRGAKRPGCPRLRCMSHMISLDHTTTTSLAIVVRTAEM